MVRYRITEAAEADRTAILADSRREHGDEGRRRYSLLITAAVRAVAADPERAGAHPRPELGDGLWTFHLATARRLVPDAVDRVRHPTHFVVYRTDGQTVWIVRILHDAMDLPRRIRD